MITHTAKARQHSRVAPAEIEDACSGVTALDRGKVAGRGSFAGMVARREVTGEGARRHQLPGTAQGLTDL
ncbi:hypothetical protein G4Z16_07105 [Streptomyces bathyalis]|uniref:Uncharacterized protein n=1 Tax=Streptomyces bathyalis TaxID=2710756 RepID=A0A7T1T4J0_9ACTN|nr:hypothetical protein [Streptomyces bathyalis]QPP06200.1 hypothetical protein G4Z16_07105 [Streptomyces bathyalis]